MRAVIAATELASIAEALAQLATPQTEFGERIASRTARVGIIGLGYAGLPLAMSFAEAGFGVTGIDLNAERVRAVRERKAYLVDVPEERYRGIEGSSRPRPTTRSSASWTPSRSACRRRCRRPHTRRPAHRRGGRVRRGEPPSRPADRPAVDDLSWDDRGDRPADPRADGRQGRRRLLPRLRARARRPGNGVFTIQNTPKLVAGVTEECLRRTELLYRQIVDVVIPVSRPMVAETAKLHENTFRAVNIALANELALMCDRLGISPWR